MFILTFYRVDKNQTEQYLYIYLQDAEYHMSLFEHDDSGLYSRLEITDEQGNIWKTQSF